MALLTACTQSDDNTAEPATAAIAFGAYSGKYVYSRAGQSGNMSLPEMRQTGFGVFAYNTDTEMYTEGSTVPNFMYNQRVADESNSGAWTYSPLKYWPFGRVSYFAYAPYVTLPLSDASSGITSLPSNAEASSPTISYRLATAGKRSVDLLRGTGSDGKPLTDLTSDTGTVKFYFRHALTKIGGEQQGDEKTAGLTIILNSDGNGNISGSQNSTTDTKVTLRSVLIEQIGIVDTATNKAILSVPASGTFNLLNGQWTVTGTTAIDTTVKATSPYRHLITVADSTDAYSADGSLSSALAEPTRDKYISDPVLPEGRLLWDSIPQGVTTTEQSVYGSELSPMLIIPAGGYKPLLRLTVSYVMRTRDPWLIAGHTDIAETLTRTFTLDQVPLSAHRYHITIHLGLHAMSLDGNLEEWLVPHGTIIHDKTTQEDNQGPDIHDGDPTDDDHQWMAKPNRW